MQFLKLLLFLALLFSFGSAMASTSGTHSAHMLVMSGTVYGLIALVIFISAYLLVISEELLHLRKSKPVIVAAGAIWILVAMAYMRHGDNETAAILIKENILEFGELMLFLLSAMTYINTMQDRNIFAALRAAIVSRGYSFRTVFWITGLLAFFISPFADNLTTALVMAAVVIAIAHDNKSFVTVGCINIVVAANAGGAFSPFGDITTLMVWQKGLLHFDEFFRLFLPSIINWLVPAVIMSFFISNETPQKAKNKVVVKTGGYITVTLFIITIALAVGVHNYFNLPPMLGMMTGLGLLKVYGHFLQRKEEREWESITAGGELSVQSKPFDIFDQLRLAEWDTLMFFYGVVLSVGGLDAFGYLTTISHTIYTPQFGITQANVIVGLLSSVIDNIPVMFSVISMHPNMSDGQWLLVTLTAGVGGSLLSVGSAAGVALMGQARGKYTFLGHLKWSWAIALGYAASIWAHTLINAKLM